MEVDILNAPLKKSSNPTYWLLQYSYYLFDANELYTPCRKEALIYKIFSIIFLIYEFLTSFQLFKSFFMRDCGISSVNTWLMCSNGNERGSNNTECCKRNGVLRGDAKFCASVCDQFPTIHPDRRAYKCVMKYKTVLGCHHMGLKLEEAKKWWLFFWKLELL